MLILRREAIGVVMFILQEGDGRPLARSLPEVS